MKKIILYYMLPIALTTLIPDSLGAEQSNDLAAGKQVAKRFDYSKIEKATLPYLLYLPADYKPAGSGAKGWPLMLFLHGAGERGTNLARAAIHGPPMLVNKGTNFPFVLISPQCPEGRTWSRDALLALLDDALSKYNVDPARVYVTGLSMGGYGTWDLGMSHPERFAAIAPICGGGETLTALLTSWSKASALQSLGIWAFHGAKDPVVPLNESERMVQVAKRVGIKEVKFTVYPEADHNSWTEAYNSPELYEWFLAHSKKIGA